MSLRALFAPRMDIGLSENRVRLTNSDSGATIERVATRPFSTEHLLVADPAALSALLAEMIRESQGGWRLILWPSLIIHATAALNPVERNALMEMTDAMGFRKVEILG